MNRISTKKLRSSTLHCLMLPFAKSCYLMRLLIDAKRGRKKKRKRKRNIIRCLYFPRLSIHFPHFSLYVCTVGQINQKPRCKYRATHSSVCLFARTAHLFACSAPLASLARSAAFVCTLAHFPHSLACGSVNY